MSKPDPHSPKQFKVIGLVTIIASLYVMAETFDRIGTEGWTIFNIVQIVLASVALIGTIATMAVGFWRNRGDT